MRRLTNQQKKRIIRLRKSGHSYRDIGERIGFSCATVGYWINPETRRKTIERSMRTINMKSPEEQKEIRKKGRITRNKYFKNRYKKDKEFRNYVKGLNLKNNKERYRVRKEQGLCASCGNQRDRTDRIECKKCRKKQKERRKNNG